MTINVELNTETTVITRCKVSGGSHQKAIQIDTPEGVIFIEMDDKVLKSMHQHLTALLKS